MSSGDWNKNWSIDNRPIFQKLMDLGVSYYHRKISKMFVRNGVTGVSILELGCGTGRETIWMMRNLGFKTATVVDFSAKALEEVERFKGGLSIKLIKEDILKLDLKEKFDLVHSGFVVEHFYGEGRESVIKKHAEFVKDNGFVFVQAPGKTFLSLLYSKTINKMNGIDELLYTRGELETLFKKADLEIIEFLPLLGGSVFFILAKRRRVISPFTPR